MGRARSKDASLTAALDERGRVLELLRRHGFNTTSFQTLEQGLAYWWAPAAGAAEGSPASSDACVAYADTGSAWVAAGAPIAAETELARVARRFADAARSHGRRAIFFASQQRLANALEASSTQVGLQPVWDPRTWEHEMQRSRSLRKQLQRARNKGVRVRRLDAEELADATSPARRELERLLTGWLATRAMSPLEFLVRVEPFTFPRERRAFAAERDGRVVGFACAIPVFTRDGWFVEDLVRSHDAPNGTVELLVDAAMRQAAREGSSWVTLGLAPLAGDVPRWMHVLGALGRRLYDFAGLHAFKAKLSPSAWEPVYVTHPRDVRAATAILDVLRAFAGGPLSRFLVRTLVHAPALSAWMLAVLLVPWTLALALAPREPWFPSEGVRQAWVALDVVLCGALFSLSRRFRPRLARVVALTAAADALCTVVQIALWNAGRVRGVLDALFVGAAACAPPLAAAVLWRGARLAQRRVAPKR